MRDWLNADESWQTFFSGYDRVVLIANSDAVAIDTVTAKHGDSALYVFFNKVYKVLSEPFGHEALLVARSSPSGANIVYRREVAEVLGYFPQDRLTGILGLACHADERFSPASAFEGRRVGSLQLGPHFANFYPSSHVPTSGFGLALWLAEKCETEVYLEGFTARRSLQWKLFADHDWTFEQTCLRLLARAGKLRMSAIEPSNAYVELAKRFPEIDRETIAATAVEVLANRTENASVAIDRLYSLTRIQGRLDGFLRSLKPKTRKARDQEERAKSGS